MFGVKCDSSILEVTFTEGEFSYSLLESNSYQIQAIRKEYVKSVNIKNINSLISRLFDIVEYDYGIDGLENLRNIGKLLYQQLIPNSLSELLSKSGQTLTIVSKRQDIPWELLHDGEEFLGIKHMIGRCIVGYKSSKPKKAQKKKQPSCLLISNPSGDLPGADTESKNLMKFFRSKNIDYNYLTHYQVSVSDILMNFNSTKYDFIHYNGHIGRDPESNELSFVLAGNEYFSLNSVGVLEGFGNPFVFLNGCGERIEISQNQGISQINKGIVIPFIYAGAQAVIGSTWKVSDDGARIFAEKLYSYIMDGETVGNAMAITRAEMMRQYPEDSTWASFVLFGNAGMYYIDAEAIPKLPGKLDRSDFTDDGWRVIEYASKNAKKSRLISTTHLFCALSHISPGITDELFNKVDVPSDEVLILLDEVINMVEDGKEKDSDEEIRFSLNTSKILVTSGIVASMIQDKIGPEQILTAFYDTPEANVYNIIQHVQKIYTDKKTRNRVKGMMLLVFDSDGNLREESFSEEFLRSLQMASDLTGEGYAISTTHIFLGILSKLDSKLGKVFCNLNISAVEVEAQLMKLIGWDADMNPETKLRRKINLDDFSQNTALMLLKECGMAHGASRQVEDKDVAKAILSMECSITNILSKLGIDVKKLALDIETYM